MNRYDKQLRATAKQALANDVFGNEELPAKIAPMLVELV